MPLSGAFETGASWHEPVPLLYHQEFGKWVRHLKLKEVRIPRCVVEVPWTQALENLRFTDMGETAEKWYGAVVYIRAPNRTGNGYTATLIVSKARVSPLKGVTLRGLELLAILLAAKLVPHVYAALKLPESCSYNCWSDSKVLLA